MLEPTCEGGAGHPGVPGALQSRRALVFEQKITVLPQLLLQAVTSLQFLHTNS